MWDALRHSQGRWTGSHFTVESVIELGAYNTGYVQLHYMFCTCKKIWSFPRNKPARNTQVIYPETILSQS